VPNESTSITQPLFVNHCLLFAPIRSVLGLKERVRGTCSVVYKKNTKQGDGQKGGRRDEYEYTSVFLGFIYYLFLDTYQPIEIPTVLDSCSPHRFPHALPRFARRGPDRSISITSLHHSNHRPFISLIPHSFLTLGAIRLDRIHFVECTTTIRPSTRLPQVATHK
jgi:hypothetical protein